MKKFRQFIADYATGTDKRIVLGITVFTGLLIYFNYVHRLEEKLTSLFSFSLPGYFVLFFGAYLTAFGITAFFTRKNYFTSGKFLFLVVVGALLFAVKTGNSISTDIFDNSPAGSYWNEIVYWPLRLCFFSAALYLIYRMGKPDTTFFGLTTKNISLKPYFFILLFLIPFIILASTQPDFLASYPKLNNVIQYTSHQQLFWLYNLLYELSYGCDFISIELFFRGFLIFAFVQYAGKDVILPMACFYCTIHFGKPLLECISSFPGGVLLGIISYNTRSIVGGLMVHVGMAWMMELGGYLGNLLR